MVRLQSMTVVAIRQFQSITGLTQSCQVYLFLSTRHGRYPTTMQEHTPCKAGSFLPRQHRRYLLPSLDFAGLSPHARPHLSVAEPGVRQPADFYWLHAGSSSKVLPSVIGSAFWGVQCSRSAE
jgi:hypothetical protein